MKIKSSLAIYILILLPLISRAQDANNKVLMTVDSREVQTGEVIRMYKKSQDPSKKSDPEEYLNQYIIFKLKVADAINEGFDTTKAFKNELTGYRKQLAENYLTDTQTKEMLLKKAYERSLNEINAWHILISLPQEASPADTLKAWNKAVGIRERILKGESFENVARGTSDDPSVKVNGGNLGYFTAFQMIMPFEDAAYNLKPGKISEPVRTPYGYHIIQVTDRRHSKGKIKVAHIMKSVPPGTADDEAKTAENEINDIYKQLQAGASFRELAKKYSDHKESAVNGGELNWFGTGEIIPAFSEAAFSLSDTGEYTKPVRTIYGWHIIKLLDKKAPGSFEESKSYLESKLNQSYLNTLSRKSFIEKLRKNYKFTINKEAHDWFVMNTDTLIIQGLKKYDRSTMPDINLYTFEKQYFTTSEFADYLENRRSVVNTSDPAIFINSSIEARSADNLIEYENSILEMKYPEFRYLMNEFHDGILMFDISGIKVWNKVSEDSIGLHRYYEENRSKYLSPAGIEAKIYTLKSPDGEKLLGTAFEKYSHRADIDRLMLEEFNTKTDTMLVIKEGKWHKGDNAEIDKLQWVPGIQSFKLNGFPSLILISKVSEPAPMKFEAVQGELLTGYQEYLENEWIKQLKAKYTVKIDSLVLEEFKKKLSNE